MGLHKVIEMWVRWRLAAGGCSSAVGVSFQLRMGEGDRAVRVMGENQRAGGKKKHICRDEITQPCIKNKQLKYGGQRVFNGFFESFKNVFRK